MEAGQEKVRIAVINSHPIQYFAPLYRALAERSEIDLTVLYCCKKGLTEYADPGFGGESIQWDVPLLEGYKSKFFLNLGFGDHGFLSLINPGIIKELLREKYDIVWVHGYSFFSHLSAMLVARLFGSIVAIRGETHLLLHRHPKTTWVRNRILRNVYRIAHYCLPIGSRNRQFYLSLGIPESRLIDVPYTVDNAFFQKCKNDNDRFALTPSPSKAAEGGHAETARPTILFCSKFTKRKRPLDLLKAVRRLQAEGHEFRTLMVGTGVLLPQLQRFSEVNNLIDVKFLGFLNQSELPEVYQQSDVFVIPSENEPWGLIINEVMSAGLPVVAADEIGAVPDLVIHGKTGLLFKSGDVRGLAGALSTLIKNAELRTILGVHAVSQMQKWSIRESVDGVIRLSKRVAG